MMQGFTAQNWKHRLLRHPTEDFFMFDKEKGIMIVADGVTCDPWRYLPRSTFGKLMAEAWYPKLSPAADVARHVVRRMFDYLAQHTAVTPFVMREAFEEGNLVAQGVYASFGWPVDYVKHDFPGCVACAAVLARDSVTVGFLTDCGVGLFNDDSTLKRTPEESPHRFEEHFWDHPLTRGRTWRDPIARAYIRRHFRNNPHEEYSFGVLTGQPAALEYVRTATWVRHPSDVILAYSDGLAPIIYDRGSLGQEFHEKLYEQDFCSLERMCRRQVEHEGTVVAYVPD